MDLNKKETNVRDLFCNYLLRMRVRTGYSQNDVANKLNINRIQYHRYESGTQKPTYIVFLKLLHLYKNYDETHNLFENLIDLLN